MESPQSFVVGATTCGVIKHESGGCPQGAGKCRYSIFFFFLVYDISSSRKVFEFYDGQVMFLVLLEASFFDILVTCCVILCSNLQTCVLNVNIHCNGCEKKVKKIIHKIDGKIGFFYFIK